MSEIEKKIVVVVPEVEAAAAAAAAPASTVAPAKNLLRNYYSNVELKNIIEEIEQNFEKQLNEMLKSN
jgi:hypothetical protein